MKRTDNNYVVRIYRREAKDPYGLRGIVEDVSSEGRQVFRSLDELVRILAGPGGARGRKAAGDGGKAPSLRLKLPVTVKGTDTSGERFAQKATLEDLGLHGLNISMARSVKPGCSLRLSMGHGAAQGLWVRVAHVGESHTGEDNMVTVLLGGIL